MAAQKPQTVLPEEEYLEVYVKYVTFLRSLKKIST